MSVHPHAKWTNKTPQLNDILDRNGKSLGIYYKDGSLRNFKLANYKSGECGFHLDGNSKGYSEISINTDIPQNYTLEKLLGKEPCEITLLKSEEGAYSDKLKLPNKRDVWVRVFTMDPLGNGKKTLEIDCYFNHNDLPNN